MDGQLNYTVEYVNIYILGLRIDQLLDTICVLIQNDRFSIYHLILYARQEDKKMNGFVGYISSFTKNRT